MTLIQIDPIGWIPDPFKQQIIDGVVTFVSEQAKKTLGDEVGRSLDRLRSDAAFQRAVDKGLKEATDRFVREYMAEDEDLVVAIADDPDFWQAKSVREALLEIIRHPGRYLAEDRAILDRTFVDVLRRRVNRERVDRAVTFYLRCVADALWHLEPLRPIYELQLQRMSVERATEMVQELRGIRSDVQQAMIALVGAMGEQQAALEAESRPALPLPRQICHNLPQPDYGTFIGRQEELAQVHRILRPYPHSQHSLVTIDGIGGIGKSALALEVAHRYLRGYDRLPEEERFDAVIWTSAKAEVLTADGIASRRQVTRTLDDIYTTIAVTLEREDITRARPEEQDGLVSKALTRQRTLLIVDNLETVDDEGVNAFLRELPAPTKAIVTTRHRVDVAYPVRLTGMPEEDALNLIAQECEKKGVTLTNPKAERLYQRTGGVPLAIVWSIAQMGYGYDVDSVLQQLGKPHSDIALFCFERAVSLVRDRPTYHLLMALASFAVDASREALGYVGALPELDRDEGLVRLEKLSLVNRSASRFSLLPLTKQYAATFLASEPHLRQSIGQRWIEWLTDYAERYGGESWDWRGYRALDLEIENILAMVELGLEREWVEVLVVLRLIIFYMAIRGRWAEMIYLGREAIQLAQKKEDWLSIGVLGSHGLAWTLGQLKRLKEAEKYARIGLRASRKAGETSQLVYSLRILGQILRKQGRLGEAVRTYEEALALAEELGDRGLSLIGNLEGELGKAFRDMGKHGEAWQRLERATQMLKSRAADKPVYGALLGHMGKMAYRNGDLETAQRLCEDCLDIFDEIDGVTETGLVLARIYSDTGQFAEAAEVLHSTINLLQRLGMVEEIEEAESLLRRVSKED